MSTHSDSEETPLAEVAAPVGLGLEILPPEWFDSCLARECLDQWVLVWLEDLLAEAVFEVDHPEPIAAPDEWKARDRLQA